MQNRSAGVGLATSSQHAPYVGPRPFTKLDRDIFFGRNQETIELTSLIKAHPELLLYAPSGAGKTSLLFAQVLPILESKEDFDMLPPARVRSQESAIIPDEKVNNIYVFNALKDLSNDTLSVIERAQLTLADFLAKKPRALSGEWELQQGDQEAPERRIPRVVVFDQFEEIFTLYPERYKDRQDFFVQVAAALEADQFLRVVFSMREDYIADLDPYADILPEGLRTRFRLERLRKSNALACVKRPLESDRCKETRRYFEDNVAESLVDRLLAIKVKSPSGEKIEVPGEFVDPVQLQVVCQTLWEKLPPDDVSIGQEDIDKYANVDEALLDFYETSIRNTVIAVNSRIEATAAGGGNSPVPQPISEGVVRGWFEQKLITRENKRNMVNRERDTTATLPNVVVDELENQHLIRVELRGGEPWYELSHDRFIPPIRESNRRFLLQQPVAKRKAQELEQRAEEWWDAQRNPGRLLNRGELADAQNWMRTEAAAIGYSNTLYSLIQASKAAIEHKEKLHQQALTDALQQKATLERQRSRQLKWGLAVASVLFLAALGSAVRAYRAEGRATRAATAANDAQTKERKQRELTDAKNRELQTALGREAEERGKANKAREDAEAARLDVEKALDFANKESSAAQEARQQAETALESAKEANDQLAALTDRLEYSRKRAYSLTAASAAELVLTTDERELALLLALKSADEELAKTDTGIERSEQAKAAVRRAWLKFTESRELEGHDNIVWRAAYGPNGQIFTMSEDGTVRIWPADLKGNPTVLNLEAPVHDMAVTPDGKYLATEQMNNEGSIWSLSDLSAPPVKLTGLTGPVATLAFSPDGKLLVTEATDDPQASTVAGAAPRIWNVPSGTVRAVLRGHQAAVCDVAFSPNGELVATASWDGTARTWDSKTGTQKAEFKNHKGPLTSIAFDSSGQFVVTASFDGTARVWNAGTGVQKSEMIGHEGVVISAVFSPNGRRVLTAGKQVNKELRGVNTKALKLPVEIEKRAATRDSTARIWNAETGQLTTVLRGHTDDLNQATFSSDGNFIVTASADGTAKLWTARDGLMVGELRKRGSVASAAFSADGKLVLLAGIEASVWRLPSLSETLLTVSPRSVTNLRFHNNGELVVASTDGSVHFSDMNTKSERVIRIPGTAAVLDVALSPDNRYVVTASTIAPVTSGKRDVQAKNEGPDDRAAHVWSLETRSFLPDLKGHEAPVFNVLFSRNGESLLTVSSDRVQVWQVPGWQNLKELKPVQTVTESIPGQPRAQVLGAAFAEQKNEVVIIDDTASVQIWEIGTNNVRTIQLPYETRLLKAAFNATATRIVTANEDGYLRVWTTEGKNISTLAGGDDVYSLAFSNDNRLVAAGLYGGIQIWEAVTGRPITEFSDRDLSTAFRAVAFDSTNSLVVAATSRGLVKAFNCEVCQPFDTILQLALQLKPRELTSDELDWFLPGINDVTTLTPPDSAPRTKAVPKPNAAPKPRRGRSRRR